MLHIRLQQDDDWPPFDCEQVRGERVAGDRYRVLTPPAFVKRLAVGDVVTVHRDESGRIWIDAMAEPGDHSTVRVIIRRPDVADDLSSTLTAHGCQVVPSPLPNLLTVDVPGPADYAAVRRVLADGERQGDWEFQEAAVSLRHSHAIIIP